MTTFYKFKQLFMLTIVFILVYRYRINVYAISPENLQSFSYEFMVNKITYSGTYVGETANGMPEGDGTFQTDENSPNHFIYEGSFKKGLFCGKGTITYEGLSQLSGTFKNGLPYGTFRLTYSNGNYSILHFKAGFPYKEMNTYSDDSKLISKDFFFDYEPISSLKKNAESVPYKELFSKETHYFGNIIKLNCSVLNIYEEEDSCTFKVADSDGHLYWGSYKNNTFNKIHQAIIPVLHVGDTLELYAFFKGISSYHCPNDYTNVDSALPTLAPITGTVNGLDIDLKNMAATANDYKNVMLFPFYYYGQKCTLNGIIENVIYSGKYHYIKLITDNNEIYYLYYNSNKIKSISPIIGERIQLTGTYNGLYKEYNSEKNDYSTLYPILYVKKYK